MHPQLKEKEGTFSEYTHKLTVVFLYALLYAIALNFFWRPANIYTGGITGFSQIFTTLFEKLTGFEPSISLVYYVLNIPFLIYGWFKMNKKLVVFTLVSVTFATVAIELVPRVVLTEDPIICALFGGAIGGCSLGLALKNGIATGGLDIGIIAIRRKTGKSIGYISVIINTIIVIAAGFLFGFPYAFYSVISIFVSGKVTDFVYTKQQKMQVLIITKEPEKVIAALKKRLLRGITVLNNEAEGAYDHRKKSVLLTVITRFEMNELEEAIEEADPESFVSISENVHTIGKFDDFGL
ncbi:MAG: YitT family protein [Vagococcus sp.]